MAAPGGGMEGAEEAEGFVLGRLEQEALKRRERLKALRQRTLQVDIPSFPRAEGFQQLHGILWIDSNSSEPFLP